MACLADVPTDGTPCVVAIDGPSGLDFDNGAIDEGSLKADLTVTFALPKWGQVTFPAPDWIGDLVIADIGIPDSVELPPGPELVTPDLASSWLPERPLNAHKGTFGKLMIVAGSANYTGAAILASSAAVRAGTGLVTLALPGALHSAVVPAIPEVTYVLLPNTLGVVDEHAVPVLLEQVSGYDALLVGPGLGNTPETSKFVERLLAPNGPPRSTGFLRDAEASGGMPELPPLVVDADGLNILSEMPRWHERLPPCSVLTPHPGEMSRLTGKPVGDIQRDRLAIAQEAAESWRHVVVLKGAFTVIAAPDREPMMLPFANPGLSSAGTGDVLAGTIAGLRAQGVQGFEAAVAGGYLHGMAGEIATRVRGRAGLAARDIVETLPAARERLRAR
jgi:NAD(P)H-hydrate epimerase